MTAVARVHEEERTIAAQASASDADNIMNLIGRLAADPTIDIDRVERFMEMHQRTVERAAKGAFAAALSLAQPKFPVIVQRGTISTDKGKTIQSRFAKWEDINEAIQPILAEHGFALSFRTERGGDQVIVTCILSHSGGHSEQTTLPLPLDLSGSKNNVQGVGSSISYGKRYTATSLLNITSRGEDDDGQAAGQGEVITDDQAETIRELIGQTKSNVTAFLAYLGAPSIPDIPASKFKAAMAALLKKMEAGK